MHAKKCLVWQVLHSPGWTEVHSDKLSLQDGQHKFHLRVEEDNELVFIAGKAILIMHGGGR